MTDLDAKLDYILRSNAAVQVYFDEYASRDYDKLIPEIKQAFADAGYRQVSEDFSNYYSLAKLDDRSVPINGKGERLLSGQEWLTKFVEELSKMESPTGRDLILMTQVIIPAARKAAGIE